MPALDRRLVRRTRSLQSPLALDTALGIATVAAGRVVGSSSRAGRLMRDDGWSELFATAFKQSRHAMALVDAHRHHARPRALSRPRRAFPRRGGGLDLRQAWHPNAARCRTQRAHHPDRMIAVIGGIPCPRASDRSAADQTDGLIRPARLDHRRRFAEQPLPGADRRRSDHPSGRRGASAGRGAAAVGPVAKSAASTRPSCSGDRHRASA
jgi:hypothetical protein